MAEPIISFKKLNITFGENVVINNIDLDIRQGGDSCRFRSVGQW